MTITKSGLHYLSYIYIYIYIEREIFLAEAQNKSMEEADFLSNKGVLYFLKEWIMICGDIFAPK